MPDGKTPVGENINVIIKCLNSSGSIQVGDTSISNILPEYSVRTDPNGKFHFPTVLRGRFILTADTGVPDSSIKANSVDEMETERFYDDTGNKVLNVRLYGQTTGVVPAYQKLTADIRLNDVAGIKVTVVDSDGLPAPYAQVTVKTESTLDNDSEFAKQIADENGIIDFFPIIEGRFSVAAKLPNTPSTGQTSGEIPIDPPNGTEIPIKVTLGAVTTSTGQIIKASIFGTVQGIVYKADGTPLSNPSQVRIIASGASILTTSDSEGKYIAEYVPGGTLKVEVFEPFTARRGSASGILSSNGQIVNIPVTLIGLGTVSGQVFTSNGTQTVTGADVILTASGNFTNKIITRTESNGIYNIPGVPLGDYTVIANDYQTKLTGKSSGTMLNDGDINTTDIVMLASGSIKGIVYAPGVYLGESGNPIDKDGNILSNPPVANGIPVTISGNGYTRTVQTDSFGVFDSGNYLPIGSYKIIAKSQTKPFGTSSQATITQDGEVVNIYLALKGVGTVKGNVLDSMCVNSVNNAQVTLFSKSPYNLGSVAHFVEANGDFLFEEVPIGEFTLVVKTINQIPLGGTVNGIIQRHEDEINFVSGDDDATHDSICLQNSGEIIGTIILPDASTPAFGAIVELKSSNITISKLSDEQGTFSFEGLPLLTYTLSILEPNTNGTAIRKVVLNSNGQVIDLGSIVLDNEAPYIVSTVPDINATDVNPSNPIVITLSELIDPKSVTSNTLKITATGTQIQGNIAVSSIEPKISFTPSSRLPDLKTINVFIKGNKIGFEGQVLEQGVYDLAGIGLASDYTYSFSTGDTIAPTIKSLSPQNNAIEVPVNSVIRIEFSEPINRDSISSFELRSGSDIVECTMNSTPVFNDQVLIFTPDNNFLPNKQYTMIIEGPVQDISGNSMANTNIIINFSTIDTLPPILTSFSYPSGVELIHGKTIVLTATPQDVNDVDHIEFYLNSQLINTDSTSLYTYNLYLDIALGYTIEMQAVAVDKSGNRSDPKNLTLLIKSNESPNVIITSPINSNVSQGNVIVVQVDTSDDVGLSKVSLTVNDGVVYRKELAANGATSYQAEFSFSVPVNYPSGSTLTLKATATDTMNETSLSNEVVLTVEDFSGPQITVISPANNSYVDAGQNVTILVKAEDVSKVKEIGLTASGALSFSDTQTIEPPMSPATASFEFLVPDNVLPTQSIAININAVDISGNPSSKTMNLKITDKIPPVVSISSTGTKAEPGKNFQITVNAKDEVSVSKITVQGGAYAQTVNIGGTNVNYPFNIPIPSDAQLGTEITINAKALDSSGNEGNAVPLVITVADTTNPTGSIISPINGAVLIPGASSEVKIQASDNFNLESIMFFTTGAVELSETRQITETTSSTEQIFTLAIPSDAEQGGIIILQATIKDKSGNMGEVTPVFVDIADITPPKVVEILPQNGDIDISQDVTIKVTFSEVIKPETITSQSVVLTGPDGAVSGSYNLVYDNMKLEFIPDHPLTKGGLYTLTLTKAITDFSGNALESETISSFTVVKGEANSPKVISIQPEDNATKASLVAEVKVVFSKPIDPSTVTWTTFRVIHEGKPSYNEPIYAQFKFSNFNQEVTWILDSSYYNYYNSFQYETDYTVELTEEIKDMSGNSLIPFTSTFTTSGFSILSQKNETKLIDGQTIEIRAIGKNVSEIKCFSNDVYIGTIFPGDTPSIQYTAPNPASVLDGVLIIRADGYSYDDNGDLVLTSTDTVSCQIYNKDEDFDGDGITNGKEIEIGTDPFTTDSHEDKDNDGLDNYTEVLMGTDVNNPDTDGDGFLDGMEVEAGLNPLIIEVLEVIDNSEFSTNTSKVFDKNLSTYAQAWTTITITFDKSAIVDGINLYFWNSYVYIDSAFNAVKIYGSNDNVDWTILASISEFKTRIADPYPIKPDSNHKWWVDENHGIPFLLSNRIGFKYYKIVTNTSSNNNVIGEIKLFRYKAQSSKDITNKELLLCKKNSF
ncbi:MAG: Ig-like domain-containing protein [Desulfobacterales bacterium]|nr:Ig-like domain-containing protein [Desulfobacterales bacterium]